jgi:6-phosphogluconolactonase (cycloisomerase 2 family)
MFQKFTSPLPLIVFASVFAIPLAAQQYLFTNDNVLNQTNSTTALKVSGRGKVPVIHTYSTGGKSTGNAEYFALSPIATAKTQLGSCLFVSNGGDSTIAAFQIDLFTGDLTAVKGSPFSDGASGAQQSGIGLAVGKNKLLFAGNSTSNSLSVLKISSSCALKSAGILKLANSPDGLKVTPNGNYLIAAYMGSVDSFQIDYSSATLKELGPFSTKGTAAGVAITCDSSTVYFGDAAAHTEVEVFSIESSGKLTELNNFTDSNGDNSNNVQLSNDEKELFVSNNQSNQITILTVGSDGGLTYDGSVKLNKPGKYALGLAASRNGKDLFVSEENNPEAVGVFTIAGTTLKEVSGSPYSVIKNGFDPAALIAVPSKSCH